MKNIIVATIIAATLIAPSVTMAQNLIVGFPGISTEFTPTDTVAGPVTKLDISIPNQADISIEANTQK